MEAFDRDYRPKGISVVIPNYNGTQLFKRTLEPLFTALNASKCSYEVIVVDDCSTDDSVNYLRTHYPQVILLENDANAGFSKTINRGIFAAGGELVLLLNSDIILTPDYFNEQLKYFSDNNTFGVMARIIGWDDEVIQDAARYPDFHGLKIKTSHNYLVEQTDIPPLPTLYLSGANALVNREKLVELHGFNELFSPFYIEDCDLSFRAWRLGWRCYYEHRSVCRHRTSTSIKAKSRKNYIDLIYNRNKMFLHAIHLESWKIPFYLVQTFMEAALKLLLVRPVLIQSFFLFAASTTKWLAARRTFRRLQERHHVSITLSDVTNEIKRRLKKMKVIKFYSGKLAP